MDNPEEPKSLRVFEVEYIDPDWRKQIRVVEAYEHHDARMLVIEMNRVRRLIRSVNRGPA